MSELVGILRGHEIYDNDPQLNELVCDVDYYPIYPPRDEVWGTKRCDYCGRKAQPGNVCKSCGASL